MSTSKRNKSEMPPSVQKKKVQDTKNEPIKLGDKAKPTADQIRIAQITDMPQSEDIRNKVMQVMDATKTTEDLALTALHDSNNDANQAVTMIIEGTHSPWLTSKKKRNKPPAEKARDNSQSGGNKGTGQEGENCIESDNQEDVSGGVKSVPKSKGLSSRSFRGGNRSTGKRGGLSRSNGKESFTKSGENTGGTFKQPRGKNLFKSNRGGLNKDMEGNEKEISDRLGQNDPHERNESGSECVSDSSDHKNQGTSDNFDDTKGDNFGKHHNQSENKWNSDENWNKNISHGRNTRVYSNYNSYSGRQNQDDSEPRPYQGRGGGSGRSRGRYMGGSRNRGDNRSRPLRDNKMNDYSWDNQDSGGDRTGYRGRMTNGPSNRGWRGGRGGRSRGSHNHKPIETWNPQTSSNIKNEEVEDWEQEEEDYTGSLADTKVFTPSSNVETGKIEMPKEPNEKSQTLNKPEVHGPTTGTQFLAQLSSAAAASKSLSQSVFNDVHFTNSEMSASDFGGGFSMNTFPESEAPSNPCDDSRVKPVRARLPPPSKIPSSAVEMPPDVGSGMTLLDVQFGVGALELSDSIDNSQQPPTQSSPPPPVENIQSQQSLMPTGSENLLLSEAQSFSNSRTNAPSSSMPQLPELLSSKSEPPTSSFYQESMYQTNQYPKSTHQSFTNYTTQPGTTYSSQSIYGSAGLGTNSLQNPYQTYTSSHIQRQSALTSTTNSKEYDVPTPTANISPINPTGTNVTHSSILSSTQGTVSSKSSSNVGKMMTVPPGVAAPIVNPQYIMNQAGVPYYQPGNVPLYSLEDIQLFQQQRIPPGHVPAGYYDMPYQNTANRDGVQYNLSDTRFAQGDTNTSPVQASSLNAQTGTQNHQQPMMNATLHHPFAYAFYGGSMIPGNFQYSTPALFPLAASGAGSGHGNSNSPYSKNPPNYTGNYTGNYDNSQSTSDYKSGNTQGVGKVQQYQVSNVSTSTSLSNMYSKSYEKLSFNCQTPPPYTLGSQTSGLAPNSGYSAQQLFYTPVTLHALHQPLHQDSPSQVSSRSQLPQQTSKVSTKPKYPSAYWHQQN